MKLQLIIIVLMMLCINTIGQDAKEIVKKANDKQQGEESGQSTMTMKIVRPTWEREVTFKSWSKGTKYSLVLITSPAKEKGQTFLKRDREMWNWIPTINRLIKLPPSMLSQGWMGSDFSNDDLLNQASIVVDYTHKIIGSESRKITSSGNKTDKECYVIELIPKEDAPVVWGKQIMWISKKDYMILKVEYYDEDEYLIKTEIGDEIKTMDGRTLPTYFELIPAEEENNKTIVILNDVKFNISVSDNFFSQQNMKRVR